MIDGRELTAGSHNPAVRNHQVDVLRSSTKSTKASHGLLAGKMFGSVVRTVIKSARLPGVSDPVMSASPSALAASIVASSTMRFVVTSGTVSPKRCLWYLNSTRITLK